MFFKQLSLMYVQDKSQPNVHSLRLKNCSYIYLIIYGKDSRQN